MRARWLFPLCLAAAVALLGGCRSRPATADPVARDYGAYQFADGTVLMVKPEGKAEMVGRGGRQELSWRQSGESLTFEGTGGGTLAVSAERGPTYTATEGGQVYPLRRRQ